MSVSDAETITLIGGLTVPVRAWHLALDLEARGLHFALDEDGGLRIGPRHALTPEDRRAITTERDHLVNLVRYVGQRVH